MLRPGVVRRAGDESEYREHRESVLTTVVTREDLSKTSPQMHLESWRELCIYYWQSRQPLEAEFCFQRFQDESRPRWNPPLPERMAYVLRQTAWQHRERDVFYGRRADALPHLQRLAVEINWHDAEPLTTFRQMTETLVPSIAAPGSVEAAIDALRDCDLQTMWSIDGGRWVWDHHMIPELLRHVDDGRLTRAHNFALGCGNTQRSPYHSVGHLCRSIVSGLIASSTKWSWGTLKPSDAPAIAEALAAVGEKAWCLTRLDNDVDKFGLLAVVRKHWPEELVSRFPAVLRAAQKENNADWTPLELHLGAILESGLPRGVKVQTLRQVLEEPTFRVGWVGIYWLEKHAPQELVRVLPSFLERYRNAPEKLLAANLPSLQPAVWRVDHPECWRLYRELLPRNSPEGVFRILMHPAAFWGDEEPGRNRERLLLLKQGLKDPREVPANFGRNVWYPLEQVNSYPSLSVRDGVALHVAWVFDIEVPTVADRSEAEWAKLRQGLEERIDRRLAGRN